MLSKYTGDKVCAHATTHCPPEAQSSLQTHLTRMRTYPTSQSGAEKGIYLLLAKHTLLTEIRPYSHPRFFNYLEMDSVLVLVSSLWVHNASLSGSNEEDILLHWRRHAKRNLPLLFSLYHFLYLYLKEKGNPCFNYSFFSVLI